MPVKADVCRVVCLANAMLFFYRYAWESSIILLSLPVYSTASCIAVFVMLPVGNKSSQ